MFGGVSGEADGLTMSALQESDSCAERIDHCEAIFSRVFGTRCRLLAALVEDQKVSIRSDTSPCQTLFVIMLFGPVF